MINARVADIITVAINLSGIPREKLLGPCQTRSVVRVRQACCLLGHQTGKSYPEIGKILGRDHSTVIHGKRVAERLVATDPAYAEFVTKVRRRAVRARPFIQERRVFPKVFKVEWLSAPSASPPRPKPVPKAAPEYLEEIDDIEMLSRAVAEHYSNPRRAA